ncbi:alanine--tRNA ligase, cytoplasmic-like [Tubulanus polymorphus]|uniref:alanine--tRNA ligase, cytoplasmic-like n=1 Tax=Tubulanus polymorphus TaxID=672921 RepID=UPI003DA2FBF4
MNCQRISRLIRGARSRIFTRAYSTRVYWTSDSVRQTFLDYFRGQHDHQYVHSSSVLPKKGEGSYFINAGMNQFKPMFLGHIEHDRVEHGRVEHRRVCNVQKCIRVGGKHNDLNDVGRDEFHHTFFEMLGNWSFADYFKKEACAMAWQLLTDVYRIPADRLYVTYYAGNEKLGLRADTECRDIWASLGVDPRRILPFSESDNFWDMGKTGPCGPCTEIHYDHVGNRDARHLVNTGHPQLVEIWNLVFMQYDRLPDQTLRPLPEHHVDTGMGLERLVAVLQGHQSNYDTDLFQPLFAEIQKSCRSPEYSGRIGTDCIDSRRDTAYRIVADHARMITVAITDGLLPGNSNLEHKLKLILDRSLHQARNVLKAPSGLLATLVPIVIDTLGRTYPELMENPQKVIEVVNNYEEKFAVSLREAEKAFEKALKKLQVKDLLKGEDMLRMYDGRFGKALTPTLIENLASQRHLRVDMQSFYKLLNQQQKGKSRPVQNEIKHTVALNNQQLEQLRRDRIPATDDTMKYEFNVGNNEYEFPVVESDIVALLHDGRLVTSVADGAECGVVVKKTPFYAEGGGQAADVGKINTSSSRRNPELNSSLQVEDVQKYENYVVHVGTVCGSSLRVGDQVELRINQEHREGCMRGHSATHVLNYALRRVLPNVQQRGSSVTSNRLTFDFSCTETLRSDRIEEISRLVNEVIDNRYRISRTRMKLSQAEQIPNVILLKEETYPDDVSVITIGDSLSSELCGGTHVLNSGDIGRIAIVSVTGVSQGTKRIVAVTGSDACQAFDSAEDSWSDFDSLKADVSSSSGAKTNRESWYERLKTLDRTTSETVLPKSDRDRLIVAVDNIRHKIMEVHNLQLKTEKLQKLETLLRENEHGTVAEFEFANSREAMQLIAKLTLHKPVILLNIEDNKTVKGLSYVPPDASAAGVNIDDLTASVCSYLRDARVNKPTAKIKGVGSNSFRQFTSKDRENVAIAIEKGREYLIDLTSENS